MVVLPAQLGGTAQDLGPIGLTAQFRLSSISQTGKREKVYNFEIVILEETFRCRRRAMTRLGGIT